MERKQRKNGRPAIDEERRARTGQLIRKYRIAAGMDQAALATVLGYTKTAIGNWELGLTRPDLDVIPILCRRLRIPVNELLDMDAEVCLPAEDRALLSSFHLLNKYNRKTVCQLIDRLSFAQDEEIRSNLRRQYRPISLYEEPAAAGVGTPMVSDGSGVTAYVRADTPGNCLIRVNGRSMEPVYPHNRYVYVDTSADVGIGQVGIFIVNGESYIKERQADGLHSYNPRFPTTVPGPDSVLSFFDRVLGLVEEDDLATGEKAEQVEAAFC